MSDLRRVHSGAVGTTRVEMKRILAMLGWFLLAIILLLLGIIAAFQHNTVSMGAAIMLWLISFALLVRRAIPILASLIAGEEQGGSSCHDK